MKRCLIPLWILGYLVLIDILINLIFPYPKDPHNIKPSFLQGYFEYGRSIEGKLAVMTRQSEDESAPRVRGGWLKSDKHKSLPNKTSKPDEILVALYGMSHTEQLWKEISKIDKRFLIRGFMAAGAPPGWSYAAYDIDRGRHKADVVVLGIMTEGIPLVTSTTGTTAYFDLSYPYTMPRYRVENKKLLVSNPPFMDAKGYIECFYDKSKWEEYRLWLAKNDKFYDPLLFNSSILDHSAFIRLLRRAYSEKSKGEKIINPNNKDFNDKTEEINVLRNLVKTFAETAREENIIPIIYLVNTFGNGDYLFKLLQPVLEAHNIPYLSSHMICPPNDPRVFLPENSHFIPSKDVELAKEIIKIIENEKGKK